MSIYVNICQYMSISIYVNICQYMSIYVNIRHLHMASHHDIFIQMAKILGGTYIHGRNHVQIHHHPIEMTGARPEGTVTCKLATDSG